MDTNTDKLYRQLQESFLGMEQDINQDAISDTIENAFYNSQITNHKATVTTDEVDGNQTDVDDFDVHQVEIKTVTIQLLTNVPVGKKDFLNDVYSLVTNKGNLKQELKEYLDEILIDTDIVNKLTNDVDNRVYKSNFVDIEKEIKILDIQLGETMVRVAWQITISGSTGHDSLVHKGRYRTGGNYPDA